MQQKSTILITGGAVRLGKNLAEHFAAKGYDILVHYNSSVKEAEELLKTFPAGGGSIKLFQADLSDKAQAEGLIETIHSKGINLDIIINSASIFPEDSKEEFSEELLFKCIKINSLAAFYISRKYSELYEKGVIINIIDTRASFYDRNHIAYNISKRILGDLTKDLAIELSPSFRVNGILPGLILPPADKDENYIKSRTGSNLLLTHGKPEDICAAAEFLALSTFISGEFIHVDGGAHIKSFDYSKL
jgi:NAD(P)-dependent dehydrogenase (short-subunit alcohol dehydrogenase family)